MWKTVSSQLVWSGVYGYVLNLSPNNTKVYTKLKSVFMSVEESYLSQSRDILPELKGKRPWIECINNSIGQVGIITTREATGHTGRIFLKSFSELSSYLSCVLLSAAASSNYLCFAAYTTR